MDRPVRWTRVAVDDLDDIASYIARDSPAHAADFAARVQELADSLTLYPRRGHVVPEFAEESLRELPFKGYRLLYEIHNDAIYIAGLIHGARELSRAWADRGRPGDPGNA